MARAWRRGAGLSCDPRMPKMSHANTHTISALLRPGTAKARADTVLRTSGLRMASRNTRNARKKKKERTKSAMNDVITTKQSMQFHGELRATAPPLGGAAHKQLVLLAAHGANEQLLMHSAGPPRTPPPPGPQQAPGGSPNQPQRAFQAPNGGNEYRLIRRP
eukprot:gene3810-biopygen9816